MNFLTLAKCQNNHSKIHNEHITDMFLNLLCYSHLKILKICVNLGNFYGKLWN